MYTITYLFNRNQVLAVSTPSIDVAKDLLRALRAVRMSPRLWHGRRNAPELLMMPF